MSAWIVYSKDGLTERCVLRSLEYGGTHMGERAVTATFDSASEVAFEVFDYIEYRGEKFELEAVPTVKKTSDFNYEYELRFVSLKYELERCEMRDLVPYDNEVVYPTPLTFSFTGNVRYLTERIQACLDALYGSGTWNIIIADGVESEEKNITIAQQNCWNALALVSTTYGLNFYVKGRTITIGGEQSLVNHTFEYGKGNGLYEIERAADTGTGIVTKLRAYGSSRNLDYSYPKRPEWGDSVLPVSFAFSPLRLMLPSFKTDGKTDFVLADEATIAKYGIREASMVYDDIYPSITGATYNGQAIDEINGVEEVDDNSGSFVIYLHDLGFDLEEHLTTSDAQISMKTGAMQGYTFTIIKIEKQYENTATADATGEVNPDEDTPEGDTPEEDLGEFIGYRITLNRISAEGGDNYNIPNSDWSMKAGDKFVLLNILMPQAYIREAENRLLARAKEYLAQYGKTNFSYNIGLHDKFLVEHPSVYDALVEGSRLSVFDEELGISEDVTIQSITITENMEENILPQVKVTLNNEPSASTLDRIQGKLNDVASEVAANGFTAQSEIMAQYRKKLDKPFFEKLFVAIDKDGNEIAANDVTTPVSYILSKYDFASKGGVTMYADGGDMDIPSIYDGLPIDNSTIIRDENGVLMLNPNIELGGGGLDEEELKAFLSSENYAKKSDIPSLNGYATESWVTGKNYVNATTLSSELAKYVPINGDTDILGLKNFTKGLQIDGLGITKSQDDVMYIDANLVVRGGITMYAEGEVNIPSIIDSLPIASTTAKGIASFDGTYFAVDSNGKVTLLAANVGLNEEELAAYLTEKKYATQSWVYSLGYASSSDLNALQTKVKDFLEGSDTDTIINKWKELESFLSGLSESDNLATILGTKANQSDLDDINDVVVTKWTQDDIKIGNWDTAYKWGDHSKVGYALKSYVDDTFVTLATKQTITGEKNFTGGLKVNGSPIVYDATNKYWKLEGDLLVTGGITMFGSDSDFKPYTIMDGVVVDGVTIRKNPTSGALEFIGSINGGIASSVDWENIENKPSFAVVATSGKYSDLSGVPTSLSSFTNDVGFITSYVDTKNTAGSTNTSSKIYLIGAESQSVNSQTYSHDTAYVGTDGCLYSGNAKVLTAHQTIYNLTMQAGAFSAVTFDPNGAAKTVNIPTTTSHISEGDNLYYTNARAQAAITGGASTIATSNLTASRALVSNSSGKVAVSAVTSTELGYLDGVTSAIQTQLNAKLASASYTAADVLTKLKTVDGSDSGLDADLLDGTHKSNLLTAASSSSATNLSITVGGTTKNITDLYAYKATQLETARTIWGQSFDGTKNLSGALSGATTGSFSSNVTIGGTLGVTGDTTLGKKLTLNGIPIYKSQDDVLYIDGNLAVRGGITMYATDAIDVSSIIEALPSATYGTKGMAAFNPNDFSVVDGYVSFIGKGGVDESVLADYAKKTDLSGYLPLTGGKMTGYIEYNTDRDLGGSLVGIPSAGTIHYTGSADTEGVLNQKKTFLGSMRNNTSNNWYNIISVRHVNGSSSDSNLYGMYIGCPMQNGGNLVWNTQTGYNWQGERVILDSVNWSNYINIQNLPSYSDSIQIGYIHIHNINEINATLAGLCLNYSSALPIFMCNGGGGVYIGSGTPAPLAKLHVGGDILSTGGITMYSDIRKKTKLQDVELTLQQIADAPLIEHYYNSDEKRITHVGSIAQYWASMNDWFCKLDGEGYYTMEIQNAALASAISIARELQRYESKTDKKIRLLKKRIGELEDEIEKLKMA